MAETDEAVLARLIEMAKSGPSKESANTQTGALKWVRRLFPQITTWREDGWTYAEIADLLDKAGVPLRNARWDAKILRTLYARERNRRGKVPAERSEAGANLGPGVEAVQARLADTARQMRDGPTSAEVAVKPAPVGEQQAVVDEEFAVAGMTLVPRRRGS